MGDLLFGIHPVREALMAGRRSFERIYIADNRKDKGVRALVALAGQRSIPVEYVKGKYFKTRLGNVVHQGVAGEVGNLPLVDTASLLTQAEQDNVAPLVLALDGIVDPQNLGSLVRSAKAMGVQGILLPKARSAPLSAAVSKASAGAMEDMRFVRVSNMVSALQEFKKLGCWVVGTVPQGELPANEADLKVGLVIVIGGEERGIRPLVRRTCDVLVSIPQDDEMDSLNAAVAGAIVMYEAMRQRRVAGEWQVDGGP
jgi:23S rRNA (guanosine2251-2'-O)-methyltransferase